MSTHRYRRITRAAGEQLLADVAAGSPTPGSPPASLLTAAIPTTSPGELPGESSAVAAYRAARIISLADTRTASRRSTALAKLVTVKAAAILILAVASGIAVAAGAGVISDRISGYHAVNGQGRNPGHIDIDHSRTPGMATHPASSPSPTGGRPTPSASSTTSLLGLCQMYAALPESSRSKALDAPRFAALTAAAGGKGQVRGFCSRLSVTPGAGPGSSPATPGSERATPSPGPVITHSGFTGQGRQPIPHASGQPQGSPNPQSGR